jgi:putative FmdB family regulatory protein
MPLFEYVCSRCGEEFEKIVASVRSRVSCPECRGRKVKRKFSLFGVKSGGKFVSSSGGGDCSGCSAKSCSNCK